MKPSDLHLLRQRLPISASTAKRNAAPANPAPRAEPERVIGPPLESAKQDQVRHSGKRLVRCQSRRVQLCDADNEIFKWHIDALRYAGILLDDSTAEIELQIAPQIKVGTFTEECVEITIQELPDVTAQESATLYAKYHREITNGNP